MKTEKKYEKIYKDLYEKIRSGLFAPSNQLPTENELIDQYGVSRITINKAIALLVEQGIVYRKAGVGTFVNTGQELRDSTLPLKQSPVKENHTNPLGGTKRKKIGCILEDVSEAFGLRMLRGINYFSNKAGYDILFQLSLFSQKIEASAIKNMISSGVEGLIIFPSMTDEFNRKLLQIIIDGFPVVTINRQMEGIPASHIGIDNFDSAYQLAKHFYDKNHRKIVIIGGEPKPLTGLKDRYDGIYRAASEYNALQDMLVFYSNTDRGEGKCDEISLRLGHREDNPEFTAWYEAFKNFFLQHKNQFSGIIGLNYGEAQMARLVLEDLGYRVPEDISIACFGEMGYEYQKYSFTSIHQPEDEIAKAAVETMIEAIENPDYLYGRITIPYKLYDYETVKKIKKV